MSVPERLLREGTDFERELLSSARLDVGSARGHRRTLAALGALASLGTASAGAGASLGGAAAATPWFGGSALGVVKWVGIGVIAGLGTTGSATWLEHRDRVSVVAASSPVTLAPTSVVPSERVSRFEPTLPEAPSDALPAPAAQLVATSARSSQHVPPAPAPRREVAPPSPTSIAPLALDAEVRALAEARAALGRGDPNAAFLSLDAYGHAFPNGALVDEATVLRIDALSSQGDRIGAALLARRFLAANPSSPHAAHLWDVMARVQIP